MTLPIFDSLLERDRDHTCPGLGREHVCVRIAASGNGKTPDVVR